MSRAMKRSFMKRRSFYLLLIAAVGIFSVYMLMSDNEFSSSKLDFKKQEQVQRKPVIKGSEETKGVEAKPKSLKVPLEKVEKEKSMPKDPVAPKESATSKDNEAVSQAPEKDSSKKESVKPEDPSQSKESSKSEDSLKSEKSSKSVSEIPESEAKLFTGKGDDVDFKIIADQLRTFKKYHDLAYEGDKSNKDKTEFLAKIEENLFSWIKPSFKSTVEMRNSFKGNGIVVCAGNHIADLAISTLRMIREVHQSDLPFEVFYIGEGDLSSENRKKFEKIPNTVTRDITKIFDNDILKLSGWAIKGFAILASSFENAMLIDSDVVFIQSPETLFSSYLFKSYGALFFHDRSLFTHGEATKKWFKDLFAETQSEYSKKLRVFNDKTAHEQESGVVLINKKSNLPGLMATCTLNVDKIRNLAYDFVFGDKETFWLGFEAVGQPYRFNGFYPGTIGESKRNKDGKTEICGRQLMHVDEQQVPTWINGGIAESKYERDSPLVNFVSYVTEPGEWTLHDGNRACLVINKDATPLTQIQKEILKKSGEILQSIMKA